MFPDFSLVSTILNKYTDYSGEYMAGWGSFHNFKKVVKHADSQRTGAGKGEYDHG